MADAPADPVISDFESDPLEFLTRTDEWNVQTTTVSSYNMFPGSVKDLPGKKVPSEAYFKFILDFEEQGIPRRTYEIKYYGPEQGKNTVRAYNLGYNGGAQTSPYPAYVNVPKNPQKLTDITLLFTGTLSGCSVIMTNFDNDNYRVYHDSRMESSLYYDNVVKAVDYSDYSVGSSGVACVFMQYRDGQWRMYVELQALKTDFKSEKSRTVVVPRHIYTDIGLEGAPRNAWEVPPYNAQDARIKFNSWRDLTKSKLQNLASRVLGGDDKVPNVPDEDFVSFINISLTNAAVKHSQAIRAEVGKAADLTEEDKQILKDSRDLDYVYLWIKQKEKGGFETVIKTDQSRRASAGHTVGERFTDQQLEELLSGNEDFATGYKTYDAVEIPGYANDMTSLEMITLFDKTMDFTQTQRGALVHRIRDANEKEFKTSVWQQTDKIVSMFQAAGGTTKPMPQDLILNAVPDEYGGRCYPLVRAMSVALAQSDFAVDQLGIKLVALSPSSTTDLENAQLFRSCLKDLHASLPAVEASTLIGRTNLQDAVDKLSAEAGKSKIFALNTDIHAMLLGVTNRGGKTSYHFYDPNFAIATFSSKEELLHATKKFFTDTDYQFAKVYGADGTASDPIFTLVELNTDQMAHIGFDFRLNVTDFSEPESLTETISIKMINDLPDPVRFTTNRALSAGVDLLGASELAEAWHDATAKLEKGTGLGEHWMPILQTLENLDSGGYRVRFVNLQNLDQTQWVSTEDPQIKDFKEYLGERLKSLKKAYEFESGTFVRKVNVPDADAIDGLNAMFVVRTLIEHFSSRKDSSEGSGHTNSNLAVALKVHSYLNLTQLGQQSLGDVAKMVELTQTIIRSEQAAQSSLSTIVRAFGRISNGVGLVLGFVNVAFDAYELSNAQNEIQKAVYGTQLAFDSASFLAGAGSAGAGLLGASSAAAVLGGVSVILGGLAFGFGALAEAFGKVAEDAKAVGRYFGDTDAAYRAGGYKYDEEHKILIPLSGAVISELDMTGNVQFDSQYIYRTHHGSTGSGYINYFFWLGDFPKMIRVKSEAINIREGIRAPASGTLANTSDYTTVILPATPKSYISYEYMILPFATTRHDYGFDIIRKLEVDKRFDYDFYIFPSEYLIRRISFEYVETPVTVKLDGRSIRIQAPSLPNAMHNVLKYAVQGAGADYTIGLMVGVSIILSSTNNSTRWVLDCRDLTGNTITVGDDNISVAGVQVTIADRTFSSVLAIRNTDEKTTEILQIDFDNHTTSPIEEDLSKFPGSSQKILDYLNDLNDKHLLHGMFITVDNYATPSDQAVGRAFYDITHKRMLYTVNAPTELTTDVQLGAVTSKDEVYFYNIEHSAIWRVDPATASSQAKYHAFFPSSNRTLQHVWQEDDHVLAVFHHKLSEDKSGELSYVLEADSMKLVSIVGDSDLLQKLNTLDKWEDPTSQLLTAYKADNSESSSQINDLPGTKVTAEIESHMLSVFGQDNDKVAYRFWIRLTDGVIIKPKFTPPPDLVLAGAITPPGGSVEEFCFYSLKEQSINIQNGTGSQASEPMSVTVPSEFGDLSNVFCVNNKLFVITKSGYILRLTSQGTLFLEAVNRLWFAQFESGEHDSWWTVLKSLAEKHGATTVAILGLHDADDNTVPAWFSYGRLVFASSLLHRRQLQITGLVKSGSEAWLCIWETEKSGHLYSQPLIPDDQLETILNTSTTLVSADKIPKSTNVLESHPFKSVVMTANGLQYTTTDGLILLVLNQDTITLYGVDKSWQKSHFENMEADLGELAKEWKHGEVIVMQGLKPTTTPAWYLVPASKLVTAENITWLDNPRWLGTDISGNTGYFYLVSSGQIYSIEVGKKAKAEQKISMAVRFDDLLVLVHPQNDFSLMTLRNVRYSIMSQVDEAGSEYSIPEATWGFYHDNVVEWKNPGSVKVEHGDAGGLLVKNIKNDLVILDASTSRNLTIRKAFGADSAYNNVSVKFTSPDVTITPANIKSAQTWLQGLENLSSPPDVIRLKTINDYLQAQKYTAQDSDLVPASVPSLVSSVERDVSSVLSSAVNDVSSVGSSLGKDVSSVVSFLPGKLGL